MPDTSNGGPYRLDELGWRQFERLCGLVLAHECSYSPISTVGMPTDALARRFAEVRRFAVLGAAELGHRPAGASSKATSISRCSSSRARNEFRIASSHEPLSHERIGFTREDVGRVLADL